ncbi:MAG: tetratricopeptide repeat protein [Muribaculaceae bacterium]|nr:tetratricopeptide repeat protein [Muribaculaceae bacterium]
MKHLLSFLLSLVIISAIPFICVGQSDNFEEDPYVILCGEADSAIKKEDYPTAALRLQEAIRMRPYSPSNVLLMSNLGMIYSMMDSDSLALDILGEAISAYPDMKTARANRAKIFLKNNRDGDAFDEFGEILTLDSLDTEARYYHGLIALYAGKLETAERDFSILEQLEPRTVRTARALSALYSLTERNREAIPHYLALIADDPAAEYYAALAGCYLQLQNLSEASATISEGMQKYPSDPELYYYRAWLNRDRYRLDDAKKDGAKAIKFGANPMRVNALFNKR